MGVFIRGWSRPTSLRWTSVVVTPPATHPVSVEELKARARITLPDEDGLLMAYIKAAVDQVERDTGLALLTQTRDLYLDGVPMDHTPLRVPYPPLQSVTSVKYTDTAAVLQTLAASNYVVDSASWPGRIALSDIGVWATNLRMFQPWVIRVVVGWATPVLIPPLLVEAVALHAVHAATAGRDRFPHLQFSTSGLRDEYEDKIAAYRQVSVA